MQNEESVSKIQFILLRQMLIDTMPGKQLNIVKNLLTKDEIYHSIMRNDSNVTCIKYEPKLRTSLCSHWDCNQGTFFSKCSIDKWHEKNITQVMKALNIWFINIKLEIDVNIKSGDKFNMNEEHNLQDMYKEIRRRNRVSIKWREKKQARSYFDSF